jgi:hypothetical protein
MFEFMKLLTSDHDQRQRFILTIVLQIYRTTFPEAYHAVASEGSSSAISDASVTSIAAFRLTLVCRGAACSGSQGTTQLVFSWSLNKL